MTIDPVLEQADTLIDLHRYDQARAVLGRRLAEDPEDVRAWVKLGRCHLGAKDPAQALDALAEALQRSPEDVGALVMKAHALRRADHLDSAERWQRAEVSLRTASRVDPQNSAVHAALGQLLFSRPGRQAEALESAREAVRLDPDSVEAYEALWMTAAAVNDVETYQWALRQVLRLEPANSRALLLVTGQEAHQPGVAAARAADMYAGALAVDPASRGLRLGLDRATYRMLRGTRWLALACLAAAGVTVDLFPGAAARELPVPFGNRVWTLAVMAAIWAFGAWRRYRRLRVGAQLNVRSLVRRSRWARIVLGQATLAVLCALAIAQIPWTQREVPQALFWIGLLPTLATILYDRDKTT